MPYYGGGASSQFDTYKRLGRIDITYIPTSTLVRRYQLTYAPFGGPGTRSVLQSLQECGVGGTDCLSPSNFVWYAPTQSTTNSSTGQSVPSGVTPLTMDVNGDSRDDLVWSSTVTSGTGVWRYMLANAFGGFDSPVNTTIANTNYGAAQILEWNGDGKLDLIVPYSANRWWVLRANGGGFDPPIDTGITAAFPAAFVDINGDGLDDLVRKFNGLAIRLRSGSSFGAETVALVPPWPVSNIYPVSSKRPQDLDRDGLEDFVVQLDQVNAMGQHTYLMRTIFGAGNSLRLGLDYGAVTYVGAGDFNSDKSVDVAYILGGTVRTSISPFAGPASGSGQLVADWDGDQKEDLLISTGGTWQLARSTGTGFEPLTSIGLSNLVTRAGDYDGDSFPDVVQLNGSVIQLVRHTTSNPWSSREFLQSATDGFGVATTFAHGVLSDPLVHTPAAGSGYPMKDITATRAVVRTITATDGSGSGTTYTLTHSYEGAHEDVAGRGFLGFTRVTVQDSRTPGVRTETTYRQDFPFVGMPSEVALKQNPSGLVVRRVSNTWASLSFGSGWEGRQFPYVSQRGTHLHEYDALGGAVNGVKYATKVTTVASIDSTSGLVTDATTVTTETATGLDPNSSKSERVYHSSVWNDPAAWCLGRPQTTQIINSHSQVPSGAQVTRTIGRSWDATFCRINSETLEPGDPQWQLATGFLYDGFGNVRSQSVTGAGIARTTEVYWGTQGKFPETITNALSQQTQQVFRYDLGLQSSITDPNSLTTSWTYDNFGRRTLETRPDQTTSSFELLIWGGEPPRDKYYVQEIRRGADGGWITTLQTVMDQYDRPYTHWVIVPTTGGYSWQTNKVNFDARGRESVRYTPWFWGSSPAGCWATEYDVLDRVKAERLYTGCSSVNRSKTYAYNGLAVTTTDFKSNVSTRYLTAWGDLAQVTDAASGATKYQHSAFGQLTEVKDAYNNVTTTVGYNVRGMKVSSTDMDLGFWEFEPNALGEVRKIRDAKTAAPNWTTQHYFDALGRVAQRDEAEGSTYFTWGTSAGSFNVGRLASVSGPGHSESLTYDNRGRLSQRSVATDATYLINFGYHAQTGLLDTLTYPESTAGQRFQLQYEYSYGTLAKIKRSGTTTEYWRLNTLDARGNVLDELLGNNVQVISGFDPLTGLLETRTAGPGAGTSIQNLDYEWDLNGNLWKRKDVRQSSLEEIFSYDALDRVTGSTLNGSPNFSVAYDLIGNITNKDGSGYTYHASKKHAVTAALGNTYTYDANGNVASKNGNTISWTSYNYPSSIAGSGVSSQFWYGPDRQRYKQVGNYSGGTETTHYVGGILEKLVTSTRTHFKHYVAGPNGLVATYTRRTDATEDTFYFTKDHLGSIDSVTSQAGAVQVRMSFEAFGKRRNESGWAGSVPIGDLTAIANTSRRGYTEHEMLDNLGLVHMNGRVQDPVIGRFLSADPIVQAPGYSQSLNRYGYVWGASLTLIDPSGFRGDAGDNGGSPTSPTVPEIPDMGGIVVTAGCDAACQDARSSAAAAGPLNTLGAATPTIQNPGPSALSAQAGTSCQSGTAGLLGESLKQWIDEWLAENVLEVNLSSGGLLTFGGLLGSPESAEHNAQIIQSQVFANSRGQVGYRSVVDTASAFGPAFVLQSAIGVSVSTRSQPSGYSTSTSAHLEVNVSGAWGFNADLERDSAGMSGRVGPDLGPGFNLTAGEIDQQQWATDPLASPSACH